MFSAPWFIMLQLLLLLLLSATIIIRISAWQLRQSGVHRAVRGVKSFGSTRFAQLLAAVETLENSSSGTGRSVLIKKDANIRRDLTAEWTVAISGNTSPVFKALLPTSITGRILGSDECGDTADIEQRSDATGVRISDFSQEEINELIENLKRLGSKRMRLENEFDKLLVADLIVQLLQFLNAEEVSFSIWALGNMQMKLNHLDVAATRAVSGELIAKSSSISSSNINSSNRWKKESKGSSQEHTQQQQHHHQDSPFLKLLSRFGTAGRRGWDRVQMLRLATGLVKMSVEWQQFPAELRESFMQVTSVKVKSQLSNHGEFVAEVKEGETDIVFGVDSRSVSSVLYVLGSSKATASDLTNEYVCNLLCEQLAQASILQGFTAQGIANALWGLARIEIKWQEIPSDLRHAILRRAIDLLSSSSSSPSPRANTGLQNPSSSVAAAAESDTQVELFSIAVSLARMRARWSDLPQFTQCALLQMLAVRLRGCLTQELVNAAWSLSKMGFNVQRDPVQSATAFDSAPLQQETGQQQLQILSEARTAFRMTLYDELEKRVPHMSRFDLESTLLSMGELGMKFSELPSSFQQVLTESLDAALPRMNIFGLHNTLVGLALMGLRSYAMPDTASAAGATATSASLAAVTTAAAITNSRGSVQEALLERVILNIHTLLPNQYGNVVWALAKLGYVAPAVAAGQSVQRVRSSPDQSQTAVAANAVIETRAGQKVWRPNKRSADLSGIGSDRLLAVLSRMLNGLPVLGATQIVWALGIMGYRWQRDCCIGTRSLAGGRVAPPLSDSIGKFLRRRTANLRASEYSVFLYSLGALQASWRDSLSDVAREKICHRATRVQSFFTAPTLVMSLFGLASMRVNWSTDLTVEATNAFQQALISNVQFNCSCHCPAVTATTAAVKAAGDAHGSSGVALDTWYDEDKLWSLIGRKIALANSPRSEAEDATSVIAGSAAAALIAPSEEHSAVTVVKTDAVAAAAEVNSKPRVATAAVDTLHASGVASVLCSLGTMNVPWSSLLHPLQAKLLAAVEEFSTTAESTAAEGGYENRRKRIEWVTAHMLYGLCMMGCPVRDIPIALQRLAASQLHTTIQQHWEQQQVAAVACTDSSGGTESSSGDFVDTSIGNLYLKQQDDTLFNYLMKSYAYLRVLLNTAAPTSPLDTSSPTSSAVASSTSSQVRTKEDIQRLPSSPTAINDVSPRGEVYDDWKLSQEEIRKAAEWLSSIAKKSPPRAGV